MLAGPDQRDAENGGASVNLVQRWIMADVILDNYAAQTDKAPPEPTDVILVAGCAVTQCVTAPAAIDRHLNGAALILHGNEKPTVFAGRLSAKAATLARAES